jgi:hypothetical protein
MAARGRAALPRRALPAYRTTPARGVDPFVPPAMALYGGHMAWERPAVVGRSLSPWDRADLARQVLPDGVVAQISPQPVQRILAPHTLQPWRQHLWRAPKGPRAAACAAPGQEIVIWSPRPLGG